LEKILNLEKFIKKKKWTISLSLVKNIKFDTVLKYIKNKTLDAKICETGTIGNKNAQANKNNKN
jgi:hypothetical protein